MYIQSNYMYIQSNYMYIQSNYMYIQSNLCTYNLTTCTYYARKKLPDRPIINTAQQTDFRIDFQRLYTLNRFCSRCMHGMVWLIEWHDHWHINNILWIIITDYLNFKCCQVTKNNSLFCTHFHLFI